MATKRVMVFGTFDALHAGHLYLFRQAKRFGTYLIVVVARDSTAQRVKGRQPMNTERDRLRVVQELRIVNQAVLGDSRDYLKVVRRFKPAVICLGYDQRSFVDQLIVAFPTLRIIRLKAYHSHHYKSSKIKPRLLDHPARR